MPPYGLYPIPRHHLYDQSPRSERQTFNSMDFADEEPPPPDKDKDEVAKARAQRKQEKRERKEKKKQRLPPVDSKPTVVPVKGSSRKKRDEVPQSTPATATKRKRESDAHADSPNAAENNVNIDKLLIDPNFLSGLKAAMGNLGSAFNESAKTTEPPTEPPPKKRGRPSGWRKSAAVEQTKADATNKKAAANLTSPVVKSKARASEKDGASFSTPKRSLKTPIPVPSNASDLLASVKKLPVPLPKQPSHKPVGSTSEPPRGKAKDLRPETEVLVTETPPSNICQTLATTPRQPPIPFSLRTSNPPSTQSKRMKGPTIDISPPEQPEFVPAKLAKAEKYIIGSQGSVNPLTSSQADAFTSSTLMSYKQKLNDTPKPRPRRRSRAVSEAASTVSSSFSASVSIKEMLARIPKRAGTSPSPFITKKSLGKLEEANASTFTTAFLASQNTINFPLELSHLATHDAYLAAASACGPLPCLHKATGCSPKNEQLLRLQFTDTLKPSGADLFHCSAAISRAQQACSFLRHALAARIPVPIGPVEGEWKLYCPAYTAVHVDKYGFGHRSLTIHRVAPSSSSSSSSSSLQHDTRYTASLTIPPRSMAYMLAPFKVPPHASFRTTSLQTTAEGYEIEVIFLGNGYLKLRVDVHLLLLGRRAVEAVEAKAVVGAGKGEKKGGWKAVGKAEKGKDVEAKVNEVFGIWEFLGIHERAVVWEV